VFPHPHPYRVRRVRLCVTIPGMTASLRVEAQFHGNDEALQRLREILDEAGVFVHVDHEFKDSVWPGNHMITAGLMVPVAERAVAADA
jgi:hypothetical protein